jgi:hypothetical protein
MMSELGAVIVAVDHSSLHIHSRANLNSLEPPSVMRSRCQRSTSLITVALVEIHPSHVLMTQDTEGGLGVKTSPLVSEVQNR